MQKRGRWIEKIVAFVLFITNSKAWAVISKLSDVQFLYDAANAVKPYLSSAGHFVRDWGWVGGFGLLAHILYESRRSRHLANDPVVASGLIASEDILSPQGKEIQNLRASLDETIRGREEIRGQLGSATAAFEAMRAEKRQTDELLRDALKERNKAQEEAKRLSDERDSMEQAWLTCKKTFGLYRLRQLARRVAENVKTHNATASDAEKISDVHVTIRFASYSSSDQRLVGQIESILLEQTGWSMTRDGSNNPALHSSDEFKVIFEFGIFGALEEVAAAFQDGRLIDASIGCRRHPSRADNHLIIEVLPTMHA